MDLDAIFVGGGVIGLSGAWRAARRGLSVAVVDPAPGHGASWVAAGMLAPVTEAHFGEERLVSLLVAGADRWASFAAELEETTGLDIGYQRCGTAVVALDTSDRAVIDDLLELQWSFHLDSVRLSGSQCRDLVPALAPGVRGGAHVPGDHQVDNRRLIAALLRACALSGVDLVASEVVEVTTRVDRSATGVRLIDRSVIEASTIVLCAGSETGLLGGVPPDVLPPVRPVKGVVLRLRGSASVPLVTRTVRGLVHGRSCYLVPRADGSLVLGATSEERGFDRTVQAGAVHALLDDARALIPGIDELELVECMAGLRPGSPDNGPFVGWTEVPGLAAATGHFRNGILLAPLTADALVAMVVGNPVPDPLSGFGLGRVIRGGSGHAASTSARPISTRTPER